MNLKDVLKDFSLENNEQRRNLSKNDQLTALVEPPAEFQNVAKAIMNGHFFIQNNSTSEYFEVHPTCVEIYYHEEQDNGVKDPIVYHRNRKTKSSGESNQPVFPLGVLHNHVSGIDITFESEADSCNKYVTDIVRASALIREFMVKDKDGNIIKAVKNGKEVDVEDRSTYLYQTLFGQFSIFDGFTIKWVDGEKDFDDIKLRCNPRKNVMEYGKPLNDESDYHKEDKQCKRAWQFTITDTNI